MNGTVLIATEFHGFPPGLVFREKKDGQVDFLCACIPIASLSTPERFSCALVNWRMCAAW